MNDLIVRAAIRDFVLRWGQDVDPTRFDDTTPLLESRHLTSLQVPELLLLIEELRGEEVDVLDLRAGDLHDIDTIVERFFSC